MPCYRPRDAYRRAPGEKPVFQPVREQWEWERLQLPCRRCLGCIGDGARMWGRRSMDEASLFDFNAFVTLTYDDQHLPDAGFLVPRHLQLFIKRLRKAVSTGDSVFRRNTNDPSFRYLSCGEYGSLSLRPHYHLLLFNLSFKDQVEVGFKNGESLYESEALRRLWTVGSNRIGSVSERSACYVAKYAVKSEWLPDWANEDGEVRPVPFLRMSRRPAIGARWAERYSQDVIARARLAQGPTPRFYKSVLERADAECGTDTLEELRAATRQMAYKSDRELNEAEVVAWSKKLLLETRTL